MEDKNKIEKIGNVDKLNQEDRNKENGLVFKPAESKGGVYSLIISILMLALFLSIAISLRTLGYSWLFYTFAFLMGSMFFTLTFGYYNMAYIFSEEGLILRWAFITHLIPYESIESIGKPTSMITEGIRLGGVGIPGYLLGSYKLLFDGELKKVSLYITKLSKTIILTITRNKKTKIYGLSPKNIDKFMETLSVYKKDTTLEEIDTKKKIEQDPSITSSNQRYTKIAYYISFIFIATGIVYFIISYSQLPDSNIPLHWGIDGQVDRWGSKTELITYIIFQLIFGLLFTIGFYYGICKKTEIGKTKLGIGIMTFPLIINLVFLILTIVIIQSTFNSL